MVVWTEKGFLEELELLDLPWNHDSQMVPNLITILTDGNSITFLYLFNSLQSVGKHIIYNEVIVQPTSVSKTRPVSLYVLLFTLLLWLAPFQSGLMREEGDGLCWILYFRISWYNNVYCSVIYQIGLKWISTFTQWNSTRKSRNFLLLQIFVCVWQNCFN